MVIKFKDGNKWGYIGSILRVENEDFSMSAFEKQYDEEVEKEKRGCDCESMTANTNQGNKIFTIAMEQICNEDFRETHTTNLLDYDNLPDETGEITSYMITYTTREGNEVKREGIVTNQKVYLLTDDGQTIERLA